MGQLQRVTTESDEVIVLPTVPARMIVAGRVTSVQKDIHTFIMKLSQHINHAGTHPHLTVRGVMALNPIPRHPLPSRNSVISFTGLLHTFEANIAIVTLDHIGGLCRAPPLSELSFGTSATHHLADMLE
jgi:hypothetical protein